MNDLVTSAEQHGVLTVTLNRPDKRNAMNEQLIAALAETFTTWGRRDDLIVAVLTGAGDRAFASGGDIRELAALREATDVERFARQTRAALDTIRNFPVPVVAALNGDALGGGAELALACDIRFMARHARIGFLQGRLNISTAWGGGADLLRLVGPGRALSLLCTTDALGAEAALALGLVEAVAAPEQSFRDALAAFVARLAARKPQVTRALKFLAAAHRMGASAADLGEIESRAFANTWTHADHWQAVEAMYPGAGKPA
jgi:enoyl-CoA hydratase